MSGGMCLPSPSSMERLFSKVIFFGQRDIPKVQKKGGQSFSCVQLVLVFITAKKNLILTLKVKNKLFSNIFQ